MHTTTTSFLHVSYLVVWGGQLHQLIIRIGWWMRKSNLRKWLALKITIQLVARLLAAAKVAKYWRKMPARQGSFPSLMFIDGDSATMRGANKSRRREKKWTESEHTHLATKGKYFCHSLFTSQPLNKKHRGINKKQKIPPRPDLLKFLARRGIYCEDANK